MAEQKKYTKGDYKRLSKRVRENPDRVSSEDFEMLQALRLSYKESLAIVFNTLFGLSHKIDGDSVCTYRIKRIESIISKLLRYPNMEIQRAADIAGCRCIMTSTDEVIKLYSLIKKQEPNLPFHIKGENNYIESPKDNGYRSIHLNVEMNDESKKVIEIQIRSLEQHNWATLVEISDLLFQSKLKEFNDKKCPDLYEFHRILAKKDSDFTIIEKQRLFEISGKYRYLEKIGRVFAKNSLEFREQRNRLKMKNVSFFLISTGEDGKPELKAFEKFDEAENAYFELFSNNPDNKNIVLTHLYHTTFEKLSIAYSNYFLTYNATLFRILKAIADISVHSFNHHNIFNFSRSYKAFLYITFIWFGDKLEEVNKYSKDVSIRKSIKKQREWTTSINSSIKNVGRIIHLMTTEFNNDIWHYFMALQKQRIEKQVSKYFVVNGRKAG